MGGDIPEDVYRRARGATEALKAWVLDIPGLPVLDTRGSINTSLVLISLLLVSLVAIRLAVYIFWNSATVKYVLNPIRSALPNKTECIKLQSTAWAD